jgi:hypothetical protein
LPSASVRRPKCKRQRRIYAATRAITNGSRAPGSVSPIGGAAVLMRCIQSTTLTCSSTDIRQVPEHTTKTTRIRLGWIRLARSATIRPSSALRIAAVKFVARYLAVNVTLRYCHRLRIDIRSCNMQRFKSARNIVSALSPKPVFFLSQARSTQRLFFFLEQASRKRTRAQMAQGPTQRPPCALSISMRPVPADCRRHESYAAAMVVRHMPMTSSYGNAYSMLVSRSSPWYSRPSCSSRRQSGVRGSACSKLMVSSGMPLQERLLRLLRPQPRILPCLMSCKELAGFVPSQTFSKLALGPIEVDQVRPPSAAISCCA